MDIGKKLGICFTTWESYYRVAEGHEPGVIDSFEFRSEGTGCPTEPNSNKCAGRESLLGGGYLFDNVSTETRNTDGPLTTCGVPQVGRITPTGTTCQQFRDNAAQTLDKLAYTTKVGAINSVSPGVFFYYTKITDGKSGDLVSIAQSNDSSYSAIPVQQGQAFLYDASSCAKVRWNPVLGANGSVTGNLPSDGDFVIGVKYDAAALQKKAAPSSPPVKYSFETSVDGNLADTGASVLFDSKK